MCLPTGIQKPPSLLNIVLLLARQCVQYMGRGTITYPPADVLKVGGQHVFNGTGQLYFSENRKWFVALTDYKALVRVNTETLETKVLYRDTSANMRQATTDGVTFAVSNDGRYIALNPDLNYSGNPPKPSLRVVDVSTCLDQHDLLYADKPANTCEFNDIWNGTFRGETYGPGLKSGFAMGTYPRNMRFNGDGSLRFDVKLAGAGGAYTVERHVAVSGLDMSRRYLSLLGMGDSYISGEGVYAYRSPTDTRANKCHNSWRSYPYQQGLRNFPSVASVACSGAVMYDVTYDRVNYAGQDRVKPQKSWDSRDRLFQGQVWSNFTPGYQGQVNFATKYHPRAILLSIGGNDINFANIVTGCVSNVQEGSCYPYYKERKELMLDIASKYPDLKATYETMRRESKGAVYVMGYPEIAKPHGNCGANVHLDADEVQFSTDLVKFLNQVIKNAASDAGVFYVDNEKALYGNRLCESPANKQLAMNGLTYGQEGGLWFIHVVGNESFHPNALGHKMLGANAAKLTSNFTASMPTPTKKGAPAVLDADPLLLGRKPSTTNYNRLIWRGVSETPSMLVASGKYIFDTTKLAFKSMTPTTLILHSEPVTLYRGTVGVGDGKVEITLPASVPPGFHTLHAYGTAEDGTPLDVAEVVYVAASETDYDGNGVSNEQSDCKIQPDSGVDADNDGVDDACDGQLYQADILADPNYIVPPLEQPVDENLFTQGGDGLADTASILTAVPLPAPEPPKPETPPLVQDPVKPPVTATVPKIESAPDVSAVVVGASTGTRLSVATQPSAPSIKLPTQQAFTSQDAVDLDEWPLPTHQPEVLGAETALVKSLQKTPPSQAKTPTRKANRPLLAAGILLAVCASSIAVAGRHRRAKAKS
jgi:hypothetical protein